MMAATHHAHCSSNPTAKPSGVGGLAMTATHPSACRRSGGFPTTASVTRCWRSPTMPVSVSRLAAPSHLSLLPPTALGLRRTCAMSSSTWQLVAVSCHPFDARSVNHNLALCSWYQGVFDLSWANAESGELESRVSQGRNVRVNFPNFFRDADEVWHAGPTVRCCSRLWNLFAVG